MPSAVLATTFLSVPLAVRSSVTRRYCQCRVYWLCGPSARFSCGPGAWPRIFGERHGSDFFFNFLAQNCAFGLVWLWQMIRQFRILFHFFQNVCVHSRPLASSAAHPQLRVPRDLKHGTGYCVKTNGLWMMPSSLARTTVYLVCGDIRLINIFARDHP